MAHILADSGARVLFHTDGRSEVVAAAAAAAELRLLVTIGTDRPAGAIGFDELVTRARSALEISGGMNVYPAEVEAALATLPGVAECAVLSMPDERWGEAVTAVIFAAAGAELMQDSVIAHVRTQIASYKTAAAGALRRGAAAQREPEGAQGRVAR